MTVYWLEQALADVPATYDWLSAGEAARLSQLRFPKRRADWLLGRWTARLAVAAHLKRSTHPQALAAIEIRAASSGAPEVWLSEAPAGLAISLSHSSGHAVCAVADTGAALGCDLELIAPREPAFISDYFTSDEQALVARSPEPERAAVATLLWSAKESALKALGEGLRLDTRSVSVTLLDLLPAFDGWRPLLAASTRGPAFHGWWCRRDSFVFTLVSFPPPDPPVALMAPRSR